MLSNREIFELEIEYVGNSDGANLFNTPPIVTYSEIINDVGSGGYDGISRR